MSRRKKKRIASQHIDRNKVLTIRGNPFDDPNVTTFVSSGVNHLRGWCVKGDTLKGHSWTGKEQKRACWMALGGACNRIPYSILYRAPVISVP